MNLPKKICPIKKNLECGSLVSLVFSGSYHRKLSLLEDFTGKHIFNRATFGNTGSGRADLVPKNNYIYVSSCRLCYNEVKKH